MASKNTEYQLAIKIAGAVASSFNTTMGTVSKALSGLGSAAATAGKVAAVATGAAATAVGAIGAAAIKAGAEYESAFAKVHTIMDTSQVSAQEMSSAIKALSSEMGISASELSDTVYNAISATGDTANAVDLARQASMLAEAGFTDTSSSLSVLTTAMNAYKLSADEVAGISDSLIQVQNLGVTTVGELASNMGRAIATASAYGVNLTNLESAYVSITKAGINTAEGTTYISSMLNELGDSGSTVSKVLMEQTGKSFDQLMAEGKSLGDVLGALNDSVNGDSAALINLWSSAEAGKASSAIVGQGLDAFNENLKAIGESAGATEKAYGIMADTLAHKTEVFKASGTNLLSSIYEGMSGQLGEIMDFANGAIADLTDAFQEGGLSGAMEAFGGVLSEGLDMVVGYLPTVMDAGMQLLGALGQGMLDNLPTITDAAVEIVIMLAEGITQAVPALIRGGIQAIGQLGMGIAEALPDLIPMIAGAMTDVLWAISDGLADFDIAPIIDGLTQGFSNAPDGMLKAATSLILNLGTGIAQAAPVLIQTVVDLGLQLLDALTNPELLTGLIQAALTIVLGLADGLLQAIPSLVSAIPVIIQNLITAILGAIPLIINAGVDLLLSLVDNLPAIISGIVAAIPEIINGIVAALTNSLPAIIEAGVQLLVALVQNLPAIITGIIAAIPQIITGITGALSTCIPQLVEAGVYLLVSLVQNMPAIVAGIVAAIPQIISAILGALASLPGALGDLFSGAWEGIKAVFAGVGPFFKGVWDTIVALFTSIGTAVSDAISGAVKGAINAVLSGAIGIINGFINAINFAIGIINAIPGVSIAKLNTLEVPQLAEGGIVTNPTLLEAGEAGNEAIIPLAELWDQMQGFVNDALAAPSNWISDALSTLGGNEGADGPEPDGDLPPIYITYSPVYHFEGEAPSREDLMEAEKLSQEEFNRMAAQWLKEAARTKFRG